MVAFMPINIISIFSILLYRHTQQLPATTSYPNNSNFWRVLLGL